MDLTQYITTEYLLYVLQFSGVTIAGLAGYCLKLRRKTKIFITSRDELRQRIVENETVIQGLESQVTSLIDELEDWRNLLPKTELGLHILFHECQETSLIVRKTQTVEYPENCSDIVVADFLHYSSNIIANRLIQISNYKCAYNKIALDLMTETNSKFATKKSNLDIYGRRLFDDDTRMMDVIDHLLETFEGEEGAHQRCDALYTARLNLWANSDSFSTRKQQLFDDFLDKFSQIRADFMAANDCPDAAYFYEIYPNTGLVVCSAMLEHGSDFSDEVKAAIQLIIASANNAFQKGYPVFEARLRHVESKFSAHN